MCYCCCSAAKLCPTLCNPMDCSTRLPCPSLSPRVCSDSCPLSQWCQPTISSSANLFLLLVSFFSSIRVFSDEPALCVRLPKYWSFSISHSNEYSGLISFRIDLLDHLAAQGTLKVHHNSKASILWHSAFFMVQLSHPYMTTGKTIALIIWTFVGKVMSLFFNMLCRFIIAFLPRSKHLCIIRDCEMRGGGGEWILKQCGKLKYNLKKNFTYTFLSFSNYQYKNSFPRKLPHHQYNSFIFLLIH